MTQKINQSIGLATEVMMALLFSRLYEWFVERYFPQLVLFTENSFEQEFCGKNKDKILSQKKCLRDFSESLKGLKVDKVYLHNIPFGDDDMQRVVTFELESVLTFYPDCFSGNLSKKVTIDICMEDGMSKIDYWYLDPDCCIVCTEHFDPKWKGKIILGSYLAWQVNDFREDRDNDRLGHPVFTVGGLKDLELLESRML